MSIPKKIHYFWMGEETPLVKKAIKSWRKYYPDFEIIRWDASIIKEIAIPFCEDALLDGNYAFVSDVVRLYVLEKFGGMYLDADMIAIERIDDKFFEFSSILGGESDMTPIATCFICFDAHLPITQELLNFYRVNSYNDIKNEANTVSLLPIFKKNLGDLRLNKQIQYLLNETVVYLPNSMIYNPSKESKFVHIGSASWMNDTSIKRKLTSWSRSHMDTKAKIFILNIVYKVGKFVWIK